MSGIYFCMFCGSPNQASPFASHFECKSCHQLIDLPSNQSTASSVASSPSTPSASTISSRLSVQSGSVSPTSSIVPDLCLQSTSEDEEADPSLTPANRTIKKRRSSAKRRDPRAPKRAANAYMLFCKHQRPLLRAARPELPFAVIGQTLGDMWRNMTIAQRKPYEARAADERDRYKMEMHAFTASTIRHNQSMAVFGQMAAPMGQSINPELLHMMAANLHIQAQAAKWADASIGQPMNQVMDPPMMQPTLASVHPKMNPSVDQLNNPTVRQPAPMTVEQAQDFLRKQHQQRQPYNIPSVPQQRMNNQSIYPSNDWAGNNQTLNVEPVNQPVNYSVNQSNNQFQYGPVRRERRFSCLSMSSVSHAFGQPTHGLLSTSVRNQAADVPPFSMANARAFDNFSSMDNLFMNPSVNQAVNQAVNQSNQYLDFPNDHIDFESNNIGLWDTITFDEM